MDLYFAGAEQPIYLQQLDALGMKRVAISFYEWQRRHSTDHIYKHVPEGMQVVVTPGVAKKSEIDWESFATDYLEFAERNQDDVLVYDFDAPYCPTDIRMHVRGQLSIMTNVVMFPMENEPLDELCSQYERVGINSRTVKSMDPNDLRRVPATLYGSNVTDPRALRVGKFAATTSFAWLAGRRYGELWVFARNKLHHYGADSLAKAVRAHRRDIEHFSVDPDACAANNKDALTAIAVYSLHAMAESLSKRPRDRRQVEIVTASDEGNAGAPLADGSAAPGALVAGNNALPVVERERIMLPVISVNHEAEPPKMTTNSASLRQCDSCYLSGSCPKYQPESTCAFMFPVEIRTDAQWEQASQVILEMQFERISFARFGEQVEGSGLSPRVGQEMDRFFKLLESVKGLKAPVADPNAGRFSQIFGGMESPGLGTGDDDAEEADQEGDYVEGEYLGEGELTEEEWDAQQRAGVGVAYEEEG
jgi:hypothetical protein